MLSINVVAIVFYVGVTFMLSVLTTLAFNPFMDSDLHAIDWVGATSIDNVSILGRHGLSGPLCIH